jgi:hypothetical protein
VVVRRVVVRRGRRFFTVVREDRDVRVRTARRDDFDRFFFFFELDFDFDFERFDFLCVRFPPFVDWDRTSNGPA